MKTQIKRAFPLPASADAAWALLRDIEAVAACMPGAKITERVDETHYKGTVSVKVGPASLSFRGEIEVQGVDASKRTLRLSAKGTDTTGGSAASMDLTASIEPTGASACNLVGDSEVSMSGKAAAFGSRLMGPVSDQVLGQFAANFAARLQAAQTQDAPAPVAKPLNAFAVAWGALKAWFRSLFAKA
jgi:carbon monoxide dehydrogenase subunit G